MRQTQPSPAGAPPVVPDPVQLARLQSVVLEQLALIERSGLENVKRRIVAGLALLCIKASLRHGELMPWLQRHVPGARQRRCNYLMSAALAFRVATEGGAGEPARLDVALDQFIAGRCWVQLLADLRLRAADRWRAAPRAHGPHDEVGRWIERAEAILQANLRPLDVGHPGGVHGLVATPRALADRVEAATQPRPTVADRSERAPRRPLATHSA
ncbi:MAG: hypothetical protein NTV51_03135, partial [Verrucomicrobia bacterium]|nr:hypothetical protein [Verrucomicrobiota bacterium]